MEQVEQEVPLLRETLVVMRLQQTKVVQTQEQAVEVELEALVSILAHSHSQMALLAEDSD
jgi:hypothetical protein